MNENNPDLNKLSSIIQDLLVEKQMIETRMLTLQSILYQLSFSDKGEFQVSGRNISEISEALDRCSIKYDLVNDTLISTWGSDTENIIYK